MAIVDEPRYPNLFRRHFLKPVDTQKAADHIFVTGTTYGYRAPIPESINSKPRFLIQLAVLNIPRAYLPLFIRLMAGVVGAIARVYIFVAKVVPGKHYMVVFFTRYRFSLGVNIVKRDERRRARGRFDGVY